MRLNHPETISPHPQPVEKLSSMKPVPDAKKVGDRWMTGSKSVWGPPAVSSSDIRC